MNRVLSQLSLAAGGGLFIIVLVSALIKGVPVLVAIFRALIVMSVGSVILAMFLRYIIYILRRFVAGRIMQRRQQQQTAGAEKERAQP